MSLRKITPVNGFDTNDSENAVQNNYAWSMAELDGYLYVGTGRNVPYRGFIVLGFEPTKSFTPENPSQAAEIWRYPTNRRNPRWERVFKMPEEFGTCLFRDMVLYKDINRERALYGGSYYRNGQGYLLKSTDGTNWESIEFPLEEGLFIRPMIVFRGKLYAASCHPIETALECFLHVSDNPENGWDRVDTGPIEGEIFSMEKFNGYLYIGAQTPNGFTIWKSRNPESGNWELIVDRGAGDALNEIPMIMEVFNNYLYVGSGINGAIYSTNPENRWVIPKGFDLIRISEDDEWEVIVGREAIAPTNPLTGERNIGLYESGFGNLFNPYCWSMKKYNGRLYLGTWDSAIFYRIALNDLLEEGRILEFLAQLFAKVLREIDFSMLSRYDFSRWLTHLIRSLRNYPNSFGFDLWVSEDGRRFRPISLDGLGNEENYGLRNLFVSENNRLYIGTANPTQGCEVWVKSTRCSEFEESEETMEDENSDEE